MIARLTRLWERLRTLEERPLLWRDDDADPRAPRRRKRQAGFALIVVTVTLTILGAVVGEFGYNARVELEAAMNGRDQLRAEYLARSGINLSRILIKVQQALLDKNRKIVGDTQIATFAPYLVRAFGGSEEERAEFGSLLGISGDIKGLGVGKDGSFDVAMDTEDGKINVNCGGGLTFSPVANNPASAAATVRTTPTGGTSTTNTAPPIDTPAQALYQVLTALFFPPRYNRIFDNPDADGQYTTRDQLARAIIDFTDVDEQRFEPLPGGSGAEDYRYDGRRDPYRAHNNYLDTVEELNLVQGVGDDFYGSFGGMLTTYGSCKVNLNAISSANWPIGAALIRVAAKNVNDPNLLDDVKVAALAQQIASMSQLLGGVRDPAQYAQYAKSGGIPDLSSFLPKDSPLAASMPPIQPQPGMVGIELDAGRLAKIATTGPRVTYRIDATGKIRRPGKLCSKGCDGDADCVGGVCMMTRAQVHIRAVWDASHFNQNSVSNDANDRVGTWVYWRME